MLASATQYWAALLVLAIAFAPSSAAAYRTLADAEGTSEAIVWEATPTVALVADSFPDGLRETVAVELEHAAEIWNDVGCTGQLLAIDHGHIAPEISIRYEPDWAGSGFDPDAAGSTEVVLQSGPEGGARLVEATIYLNGGMEWVPHGEASRSDLRDVRVVLVHELGHALGLAHNCEPDSPEIACGAEHVGMVMHPIYGEGGGTRLGSDDLDGICALYSGRGPDALACEQTADCYEGELCVEGACLLDNLFGSACAERSDCLTTYCIADSSSPAGGICTRDCETSAQCPSGADCVPVEGMSLHVCRPRGASATCSVASPGARGGRRLALWIAIAALAVARRLGCRP